jgi:hypothetical protein
MSKIRDLIAKYPLVSVLATAAATYYGGPKGAEMLAAAAKALGLI